MYTENDLLVIKERYESMNIVDRGNAFMVRYMYDGLIKKTYFDYNSSNYENAFLEAKKYRDSVYWDSIRSNTGYKHIKINVNECGGISVKATIALADGKMVRKFKIANRDEFKEAFDKAMFIVSEMINIDKPSTIDYEIGLKHLSRLKFRQEEESWQEK